jgi:hypothetical protein
MNETKKCYKCFTDVDIRAKICPACKTKLGPKGKDGIAKKYTSPIVKFFLFLFIAVFLLMVISLIFSPSRYESSKTSMEKAENKEERPLTPKVTYYHGYEVNEYNFNIYFEKFLKDLVNKYDIIEINTETYDTAPHRYQKYPEICVDIFMSSHNEEYLKKVGVAVLKHIYEFTRPLFPNYGVTVNVYIKPKPDWAEKFYCELFIQPNSDINNSKSILWNFDENVQLNDKRRLN